MMATYIYMAKIVILGRICIKDREMGLKFLRMANSVRKFVCCLWSMARNECVPKEAKIALCKNVLLPILLHGSERKQNVMEVCYLNQKEIGSVMNIYIRNKD